MNDRSRFRGTALGSAAAVMLAVPGCHYRTPAPPNTITNVADSTQRAAVLAYAHGLKFDSLTPGVADRRPLTTYDAKSQSYSVGPRATILPEEGSIRNRPSDLRSPGRIVARIEIERAYPKLGLQQGVSYVWVDSIQEMGDTGRARAVMIPEGAGLPVSILPVFYFGHNTYHIHRSLARWVHKPGDDLAWETCINGCCDIGVTSSAGLSLTTGLYR